ncbi:MAG: NADH-quinone oxidoreductase subunit C [Bacteroidota bacterium]
MTAGEIKDLLAAELNVELAMKENATPPTVLLSAKDLKQATQKLHEDERWYFDMLSCLTALDNGVEAQTIDVIYHLYSIPFDISLALQVTVPRDEPVVDTVSDIWATANWHEREAYDLMGVVFTGHEDLRRILLPNDWEGHPLRKDYQEQEKYHGMNVVYDRNDAMDN